MVETIGEKLRLARETRGIALRDISEQTRISIRYLEAIESDDYQRLPGGIFNRSFIRAYAKFIGYDEHNALEDYSRTLRERGETDDEGSKLHHSRVYTDDAAHHNRSPLKTLILAILILAALTAAVYVGLHFYQRSIGQRSSGIGGVFSHKRAVAINSVHRASIIRPGHGEEVEHDFTV